MKKYIMTTLAVTLCTVVGLPQGNGYEDNYGNKYCIVDGIHYQIISDSEVRIIGVDESITSLSVPEQIEFDGIEYNVSTKMFLSKSKDKSRLVSLNTGHITELYNDALRDFTSLEYVEMPNVEMLGKCCFMNCTNLKECSLPKVSKFKEFIFLNCSSLTSLVFETPEVTYIAPEHDSFEWGVPYYCGFFADCTSLRELIFKGRFTTDASNNVHAYKGPGLCSISIYDGFKADDIAGCTALETLYINEDKYYPNGLVTSAPNLKRLTIGNKCISAIRPGAFMGCDIQEIHCMFPVPPRRYTSFVDYYYEDPDEIFIEANRQSCIVYVPKGCRDKYIQSSFWNQFSNIVEDPDVEPEFDPELGPESDFYIDKKGNYSYSLSDTDNELVIGLAYYQYAGTTGDRPLFINYASNDEYTMYMHYKQFDFETPDAPVIIDDNEYTVTEVASFAAYGYKILSSVNIGEGVLKIGDYAFSESKIAIYNGDTFVENGTVTLPSTLQRIGHRAFENIENLGTINCKAMTPPELADDRFCTNSEVRSHIELNVPPEAAEAYRSTPVWRDFIINGVQSVETMAAEVAEGDAEYYNLQGIRVTPDRAGVYIRRAGGEVTKVVVR